MKKLVVALMLLSLSVVSCGKKNSTDTGAINGVATSPVTAINTNPAFQTLATAVSNLAFTTGNANYYTEYHFGSLVNTCVTKDGWFGIDYKSCSSAINNEQIVYHGQVDVNAKRTELTGILSKTVVFQAQGSNYFVVRTTDNWTYVIRTDLPIQANPIYKLNNADGKASQLLYIR